MTVQDQQANSLHITGCALHLGISGWLFARYAFVSDAVAVFALSLLLISESTS